MPNQHLCPFCGSRLVCQVSQGKPYWFCIHCHQEVPYAFCDNIQEIELVKEISHYHRFVVNDIDELTGLANYAKFSEHLNREWLRMLRENCPLSLILCAINFNDNPNLENKILQKIAKSINGSVHRPADLVARYRHYEFAILLPNTNLEGAKVVKERISLSLRHLLSNNQEKNISSFCQFSLGIAGLIPPAKMTFDLLIIKAEQSLAKAMNLT